MAPASRIKWLLAAHCGLAWFASCAAAFAEYPFASRFAFALLALFFGQVVVSGLVVGLLLSDSPGPTRHRHGRSLAWLCLGLPLLWLPVALLMVPSGELIPLILGAIYGLCLALGLFALVVAVTLAAFKLELTDEPNDEPPPSRKFQFSLRQLIGLTTFIAIVCALPRLAAASQGYISVLAGVLWMFAGIVLVVGAIWLLLIGIPLAACLFVRRPWRGSLLGILAAQVVVIGTCFALNDPDLRFVAPSLLAFVGCYSLVVMASLGVLRSCGLRLARHTHAHSVTPPKPAAPLIAARP